MQKIETDTTMPPGGWRYTVPETGVLLRDNYATMLHRKVNRHLAANGHPEIEQVAFEDAVCRENGHGLPWCSGGPKAVKPPTTMQSIKRFLKTMTVLAKRRELVSREEHDRRVSICEGCPRVTINGLGCHNCIDDLKDVEAEVREKLPKGNVLTCSACGGCIVWAKAWISNAVLDEAEAKDPPAYEEGRCWRLTSPSASGEG